MKPFINLEKDRFFNLNTIPDGPVMMVNYLKYVKEVDGKTGKALYKEYMNAVIPFFLESKADLVFKGKELMTLIGPDENYWDEILIVKYPSKDGFMKMISNPEYPANLRAKALADSRLVMYEVKK
jgi:uncharacterized protein (DUF1330 family)